MVRRKKRNRREGLLRQSSSIAQMAFKQLKTPIPRLKFCLQIKLRPFTMPH